VAAELLGVDDGAPSARWSTASMPAGTAAPRRSPWRWCGDHWKPAPQGCLAQALKPRGGWRCDLDAIVDAVRKYWEAGFTDIALVQIGDEGQELFLKEAAGSLLEKLRTESH